MTPTNNILLNSEDESSFKIAYGIIRRAEMTICINSMESKVRYQLFRNPSVDALQKHRKANGEAKISNFIIIYLSEKLIRRPNAEIDRVLVNMPSKEKKLKESFVEELKICVNEENDISFRKISSPNVQKNVLI